jgi:hypothetical protein
MDSDDEKDTKSNEGKEGDVSVSLEGFDNNTRSNNMIEVDDTEGDEEDPILTRKH